jgi:hypothetical protein
MDGDAPGPDDVRRIERWLQVHRTTKLVSDSRKSREREVAIRREYVERSFHELIKKRRNDWATLAARVAGGEEAARLARDEAQRALEETERRRDAKLGELRHLEVLRPGPAAYIGSAIVMPVAQPEIARIARADRDVERSAVEVVMAYETEQGRQPEYIGDLRDGSGFDIRSVQFTHGQPPDLRRIEVKGRATDDPTVMLSTNEWIQARRHSDTYWLYVVTGCGGPDPHLYRIQDPFRRLARRAERLTEVKGYVLAGEALRKEAEL